MATTQTSVNTLGRRSANWQPTLWSDEFIQSVENTNMGKECLQRIEELEEDLRCLIHSDADPVAKLELLDELHHLGVGYRFEKEIKEVLGSLSIENKDLYSTSLHFKLLRQHGFEVSQDVFSNFQDERGCFKEFLQHDTKGLLSLYEASHLVFVGEDALDEARAFARKHLNDPKGDTAKNLKEKVRHALELPLHWRLLRFEARWFIELYQKESTTNPLLLEFAKLDFIKVQGIYRKDLKEVSRWWKNLNLVEKLGFARDRLMENYLPAIGLFSEPQLGDCRVMLTKIHCLIGVIDDVYDIYGTIDELKLLTDAIDRWDVKAIEQLPDKIKLCFLGLFNTCNEIGFKILKEEGLDLIFYIRRMWADLCKSYLVEAIWYHDKYIPTLEEYLNNAWVSVGGALILGHAYCYTSKDVTKKGLECLLSYPSSIRWSSLLLRLCNDKSTSKAELKRGDVPKAIECYMHHEKVSESVACKHIERLISKAWKELNKDQFTCSIFAKPFLGRTMELARVAHTVYLHGDGYGSPDQEIKKQTMALLFEPFH